MNTSQEKTKQAQGTSLKEPTSLSAQQPLAAEEYVPTQNIPQPPRPKSNYGMVGVLIAVVLVIALSVGGLLLIPLVQHPAGQATPTATKPVPTTTVPPVTTTPGTSDLTPAPEPGVILGPQPGPASVSTPAYWDRILGTKSGVNKVEKVSFANLMDTPSLQALVTVRSVGTDARLDLYVFTNITSAHPTQLFKLTGLVMGDARISGYNTVMTAEVDTNSRLNKGKALSAMTPDLFREFDWSAQAGTFVQTAFPGIFPDLTRYQAEADQAQVNKGQESWKNDPAKVAQALATKFFQWKRSLKAAVLSGGGPQDVDTTVRVVEAPGKDPLAPVPTVTVKLSRLEGNVHNMWVVTAVEDSSLLTLTTVPARGLITSPVKLEGIGTTYGANEGIIGPAIVFDHLYTDIGHVTVIGAAGMGKTTYSTNLIFTSSFPTGAQEGMVAVYEANAGTDDEIATAVLVKVLLNPEQGVALGPLSCPATVNNATFWAAFLPVLQQGAQVERVSCGNLLGKPSIQALVTVRLNAQDTMRPTCNVYVFDQITSPRPVLLFKVEGLFDGNARASRISTILIAQIDRHSSINQGQPEAAMEIDLYREFQWVEGARTFVQVSYPGIFPDLTRYQAELDQAQGNQGENAWKYDAAKVAQALAVKLLKWSATSQTMVVSGGGPQDVDAVVRVQSTSPDHPTITVTLSRHEDKPNAIWEVTAVSDGSLMTITSPQGGDRIKSPLTVTGTGSAFEGDVGSVFVLDHLYSEIGHARGIPASNGQTSFTATVPYTTSFQGVQEGVLAFYRYSEADGAIAGVVMQKVLITE